VCGSPDVDEADLRKYLERLLRGLVDGEGIVIEPPATVEPSDGTPASHLPIVYQPSGRPARGSHLDWLATAGAIVVCATVVLNLAPVGSPRKPPAGPAIAFVTEPADRPAPAARIATAVAAPTVTAETPRRDALDEENPPAALPAIEFEQLDRFAFGQPRASEAEATRAVATGHTVAAPVATAALWSPLPDRTPAAQWPSAAGDAVSPSAQPEAEATAASTIVGVWAPDAGTCSAHQFRDGVLPTVITSDGAWAGDTFCLFTKQQQTEEGWRMVAKCSNPRERWTSQVRLTVREQRLTWSSRRGVQAYARCTPDLLMANR
jgi:hypothetical protein